MNGQIARQDIPETEPAESAGMDVSTGKKAPGAFLTISEVASVLDVQQHVLRFWETKFAQIKPLKRGGGRRYYRPEDVALLQRIHALLYTEGYTIKGVQKLLKTRGKAQILAESPVQAPETKKPPLPANTAMNQQPAPTAAKPRMSDRQRSILQAMLGDLKDLRDMIAVEK